MTFKKFIVSLLGLLLVTGIILVVLLLPFILGDERPKTILICCSLSVVLIALTGTIIEECKLFEKIDEAKKKWLI